MPRKGRIDFPGALHHVIIRGINRSKIFMDNHDREAFLLRLATGLDKNGVSCYAWALIPNHVHLLLRTGPQPLSRLMSSLLTGYALHFNRRHQRVGYLFQNRYKSILCDKEQYLLQLVRYIHLNPLRAGLVTDMDELKKYPWSGHSSLLGELIIEWHDVETILSHFGKKVLTARRKYLDFMHKGISEGKRSDLTGGGLLRSAGGWQGVLELKRSGERWRGDERILGDGQFVQKALKIIDEQVTKKRKWNNAGWDLESLADEVEKLCGVNCKNTIGRKRDRKISRSRAFFAWWAIDKLDYSATELSEFCSISISGVLRASRRGKKITHEEKIVFPGELVQ